MLEGRCPKCQRRYYGWAMRRPQYQMCSNCGARLVIEECHGATFRGYKSLINDLYFPESIGDAFNVDDNDKRSVENDE
jgi:hypothetical protein